MPLNDPELLDDAAFDAVLADNNNKLALFREKLKAANSVLIKRFQEGEPVTELVRLQSHLIDQLLMRSWRCYFKADDPDIALVAVGGYGRGELHPGSDIDVLILLRNDNPTIYKDQIEKFLTHLWDIGLEVGHSVRSLKECVHQAENDITIATNLMESRLIIGPGDLLNEMQKLTGPDHIWSSRKFFEAKWQEQQERHQKYDDTGYNLEPNTKEGPGGLRDIQMIAWVTKRHFNTDTLQGLVDHDFLTESEYQTLTDCQEFLWRVRFALHVLTGRREDRLMFDYQRTLAQQFGYQDDGHKLAVENFMKAYYRTIMELSRLNEMLLQHFQEAILYADAPLEVLRINKRFKALNGFIEVTDDTIFNRYPFALLEIFLLLEQDQNLRGVRAATIRLIRDHRHLIDDNFRNDLRCKSLFIEILKQPTGITHELRRMNRYGILAAYWPAFGQIVGQMQYDLFHVYTVDEHTLMVLRNIRRFTVPIYSKEFPRCSEIIQRIEKPEILYLGALFHDIAKGRGGDHSELGKEDAITFCLDHGISQYDANLVAWLVKNHLIMSSTAQREDISDPDVINAFANKVGNQSRLNHLYLLTVADIRGTDPNLWNNWKDSLLTDLYNSTSYALRRGLNNPIDQSELIEETQANALKMMRDLAFEEQDIEKIWRELDDDYFLRHSADEIAWHTRSILDSQPSDLPLIVVRQETHRGGTEIFLYTHDQDHLFAMTTQALDQLGLDIVDARIITSRNGFTLDTYIVLDISGEPVQEELRIQTIISTLKKQLTRTKPGSLKVSRRPARQLKHFSVPTKVTFTNDENDNYTIMDLVVADRPGLLASIGGALIECDVKVHNAKITSFGARAEDIFYITEKNNQPLKDESRLNKLRNTITEYLNDNNKQ